MNQIFHDMRLPENMSKIAGKTYKGQKDAEGRPHGHGIMEYSTKSEKKYKYEGHFVHGVRSGYGVWHENSQYIREYEPWEWAQMGEYDSAGRLIHPNTRPGPRREIISFWNEKFRGWWKNDDAVHDIRGRKYTEWNIENSEKEEILKTEQLGSFYETEGERDKAIEAYEKCIMNGYYAPIYNLALMYLEDDEEYCEILMKTGMQLGVPDRML